MASFSVEAVRDLEKQLQDLGKDAEIFVYDGADHGFFNDTRADVYDEAVSTQAWDRTLSFFRANVS